MLWSAFVIGLLSSFHCIGMCGPIALALPTQRNNLLKMVIGRIFYNVGRALTYALIGLLAGLAGQQLSIAGLQQGLSIFSGVVILGIVLMPAKISQKIVLFRPAYAFTQWLKRQFGALFKRKSLTSILFIGVLNGFLPCGMVYLALAGALATGAANLGMLYMFLFGLGTLPVMLAFALAGNFISINLRNRINKAVPVFMVALAMLFILRGMNLGIPYVSPVIRQTEYADDTTTCH